MQDITTELPKPPKPSERLGVYLERSIALAVLIAVTVIVIALIVGLVVLGVHT